MACTKTAYNPTASELPEHVDMKYQLLVDHVEKRDVDLHYVSREKMRRLLVTINMKGTKFAYVVKLTKMSYDKLCLRVSVIG